MGKNNPNFDLFWLTHGRGHALTHELPNQALPSKKKDKDWKKLTLDTLELIGIKQIFDNRKFYDFYRMYDGRMSYQEVSEVAPQLREVQEICGDMDIPTFLKDYGLVPTIINAVIGWATQYDNKYTVSSSDEIEQNAYLREKSDLLSNFIRTNMDTELNIRLLRRGINVFDQDFATPEEQQQFIEAVRQEKQAMTPPEIQEFMDTSWKTGAVMWGNDTLKADRERFYMDELDQENMKDYLLTGRCFRHNRVSFDYYKPENWRPMETFFSTTLNIKHVQYGEYVGRITSMSPSEFVNRYGHKMTSKTTQRLLNGRNERYTEGIMPKSGPGFYPWASRMVPFRGYDDYMMVAMAEDLTGMPMGYVQEQGEDGVVHNRARYMPRPMSSGYGVQPTAIREDIKLRADLMQVMETYWLSYKRMLYITYEDENGSVLQDFVTDELLGNFLKVNGIKKVTESLEGYLDDPEINTYIEVYIPEVRFGVKARCFDVGLGDDIYLDGEAIDYQIPGDSNFFDFQLPVCGLVSPSSLAARTYPYNVGHNIALNQLYNLMEKEIGIFFLFDINFIPSEYRQYKDTNRALDDLMDVAKRLSIFGMDMSKQNSANGTGGTPFNQFAPVNLSLTEQMDSRIRLAEYFKNSLFMSLGLTPQALGTPIKYETAEGVKQGLNSSMVQLQVYIDEYDGYSKRNLDSHLSVALYCQKNNIDRSIMYTKSDLTRSFLYLNDENLYLRRLNVYAVSNSKKRKELELFKQSLLQINTTGADELAFAKIFTSDTMNELMTVARNNRIYREQQNAIAHDRALELQGNQQQFEVQQGDIEHARAVEIENIRGGWRTEQQRVNALGRAADKNSDVTGINAINDAADIAARQAADSRKADIEEREVARKEAKDVSDKEVEMARIANEAQSIQARLREADVKEYTSTINKN